MIFNKRTSSPTDTNKYYINTDYKGYNRAMVINERTGSVLNNCTGLVHGRWLESQKQTDYKKYDKLCIGDAHSYYGKNDGYKRGKTPKLGSIICFDKKGGAGHVAFVEEVKSNGDIITSNSAYKGSRFFTKTLKKSNNYKFGIGYTTQGFIYPPVEFTPQYNLTRLLKIKDKGSDVKELQKELVKRGYDIGKCGIDGIFGDDTLKAVKKFQKDKQIATDGAVGKDTAHKLGWLFKGK